MRPGDLAFLATQGIGTAVLVGNGERWIVLIVLVLAAPLVSLFVWDVRRAGGLSAWTQGWVDVFDGWSLFFERRFKRRSARRKRRIEERQLRRQIKHEPRQ
jgi:hypothetical protein